MLLKVMGQLFGTKNERELKRMRRQVETINALEASIQQLSNSALAEKTEQFKARFSKGATLQSILPEAFAVCREAGKRVLGMRHFDVQLIGGITLFDGRIAEMRTGEGKTLMATLACYLAALSGQGVHVVTVNEYLAARDAELNRPLFEFLGLTVGVIRSLQASDEKHAAYRADITYGTNNEFGFDYLRDNMVYSSQDKKQRGLNFAIIDEVDSILIDEARTPLIISGQAEGSSEMYVAINKLVPKLVPQPAEKDDSSGHFWIDEKQRSIEINEHGYQIIESALADMGLLAAEESLYSPSKLQLLHHVHAAIKAHHLFIKDVHYIVRDDEVVIVDEHTGRTMPGRRWSEGLHQAIEAKEGADIQSENQTMATTTFQNYFRLYKKLSGMTGTADTEAAEFKQIYNLDVVVIPTHKPMIRVDHNDYIFLSREGKYQAIIEEIKAIREKQAPILVGTATIEASEHLSRLMEKAGIAHEVLNAKQHEREAEIIAQAGAPGAVTIATNMAGRGTDIILGGNWRALLEKMESPSAADAEQFEAQWREKNAQVLASGGLHIVGSERHESRRIDNQLRGRSGRQGDPGVSRFFLSLEDDLMRIFAGDRTIAMMRALGLKEDEAIEHRMVSRSIENAQRKVESRNFDIRKNLLKYDDVANEQRRVIYSQRDDILEADHIHESISPMIEDAVSGLMDMHVPPGSIEDQWHIEDLEHQLSVLYQLKLPIAHWLAADRRLDEERLRERILAEAVKFYQQKRNLMTEESARAVERHIMLQALDRYWKEHLAAMDYLRQGIHLRGYAQKNPEQEYKREAFGLFQTMLSSIKSEVVQMLFGIHIPTPEELAEMEAQRAREAELLEKLSYQHGHMNSVTGSVENDAAGDAHSHNPYAAMKISRNASCPCGSGKKYKHCHGMMA